MSEPNQQPKIIIVEDNDFVRMQLVKFLESEGCAIDEYDSAVDASSVIQDGYDLAILDVRMEPMGGFEFIKNMRSEGIQTPAILVTGDQDPDLLSEASKWNVAAVLIKPVQKERLIKTVQRTLEIARRKVE